MSRIKTFSIAIILFILVFVIPELTTMGIIPIPIIAAKIIAVLSFFYTVWKNFPITEIAIENQCQLKEEKTRDKEIEIIIEDNDEEEIETENDNEYEEVEG